MKLRYHLAAILEFKYGCVAGTRQVNKKDKSKRPEMEITSWRHPTIPQPDDIQLRKDELEYESHLDSIAYSKMRQSEYPPIADQLDAIWKGGQAFEDMKEKVLSIKAKYKKP